MKKQLIALLFTILATPSAFAALQTIAGTDFDLIFDDTKLGLFGAPSLSGNSIFFTPNNFKAESLNGLGIATSNSTVNGMQLVSKNNFKFGSIDLIEYGDYILRGNENFVDVKGQVRAFDTARFAATNSSSSLIVSDTTPLNIIDGNNHDWQASASINSATISKSGLANWLSSADIVNVTIENLLTAYTTSGFGPQQAFIEKKAVGMTVGLVVTSAVPEPDLWGSLAAGLFFVGLMTTRRGRL